MTLAPISHVAGTVALAVIAWPGLPGHLGAQEAGGAEVRQLVTFRFLPGAAADAIGIYREQALPLYEQDEAMLSLRVFREVESPVPLDLVVVRSFAGMRGMDASNEALRALAADEGTSIGSIYGAIAARSATHHDEFVEMLPRLANGDPSARSLVAMVRYRTLPGEQARFERTLRETSRWEREHAIASETGRFLVSDGWHYLRLLGFDSLGAYQAYWSEVGAAGHGYIDGITALRQEVIVAPVPDLFVR